MKKRALSSIIAIVCIMAMLLGGCGDVKTDNEAAEAPAAAAEETAAVKTKDPYTDDIKIGFVAYTIGDSVGNAWNEGIAQELSNYDNITYQAFDGNASVEEQVKHMDNMIDQGYDAIIIQCADSAGLAASVDKAEAAGIPVITANLDADTVHSALCAMVDVEGGRQIARSMGDAMGGKGKVVIIDAAPGATKGENINKGFKEVLAAEYPDIEIVGEQTGQWLTEEANKVMNDFLTADTNHEIQGVLCHNDAMAEGAAEAAKAAGRLDELMIWGLDGETKMLEYIEQGLCTGTVYTNCHDQGATMARLALCFIQTGVHKAASTPVVKVAPIVVTKDNVDTITPDMRW